MKEKVLTRTDTKQMANAIGVNANSEFTPENDELFLALAAIAAAGFILTFQAIDYLKVNCRLDESDEFFYDAPNGIVTWQ